MVGEYFATKRSHRPRRLDEGRTGHQRHLGTDDAEATPLSLLPRLSADRKAIETVDPTVMDLTDAAF
jgi:hypothetical protein